MRTDITVLRFGDRRLPRALAGLPCRDVVDAGQIDAAVGEAGRVVVAGADADLAAVLTRLMRADRLDTEVAYVRGPLSARRAISAG
ncbi:MAG: peptidase M50, partial [Mycobacterium sp.]